MAKDAFTAEFWDWAAYDLNWINVAAQERWMNGKGCPLDCNESNVERLRNGLQPWLLRNDPAAEIKLFDMMKILDKYYGNHGVDLHEWDADMNTVCRLVRELFHDLPELKKREITLQDWCDNGTRRKVAFMSGQEAPAPILMPPGMK